MNIRKQIFISVLSLAALVNLAPTALSQNNSSSQSKQQPNLPETTKLEHNDNLDPTVNRTQAMRAEAETGSIAPITGQPLIQNKVKPQPKATKTNRKVPVTHIY